MNYRVDYSEDAQAEIARLYKASRFRRLVRQGIELLEADLAKNGLANTRALTPRIRVAATDTIVFLIDPALEPTGHVVVIGAGEQSTSGDDTYRPTI